MTIGRQMPEATDAERFLTDVGSQVHRRFVSNRVIQSFEEYLQLFMQSPRAHARSAAQYLRDAMDFHGVSKGPTPTGEVRRFKLFDGLTGLGDGLGSEIRVAGQEEAQNAIYRQVSNFIRVGRVNRLILLHGPNGSAKTSLLSALTHSLEDYSRRNEGARYRFNWIFPSQKLVKGSIGFGGRSGEATGNMETFAHLEGEAIEARLLCDLKDHPLFLIPREQRRQFLLDSTRAAERGSDGENDFILSDYILDGELCQKCRAIYSALLAHHNGDYLKVLRHIQVERFFVSRRYQSAAAVIEPQMSVDADVRQVTADASHGALPPSLHNLVLFETGGPLIAGNRGIVEFSDLLKRPLEAYKYLLGTCETATVPIGPFTAQLDAVLIATSNEKHLNAFKEMPDFASFKARIELVRVPYLRRYSVEKEIYDTQLNRATVGKHIAPHTTRLVALWAVLTRLKKPVVDRYKGNVRAVIDDLTPMEKLALYDSGKAPDRLSLQQANELRSELPELFHESDSYPNYEGRAGASAREMKSVLFNAAQYPQYRCLTPLAVLEELDELVKDKSVYEFLQQDKMDGYHAHEEFVRVVEGSYLDLIDEEIRESMGLVSESQYQELFERYLLNVSAALKGERLQNKVSGAYEAPDEDLMASTEGILMARGQDRREFRRSLISTVGAFRLDHPDSAMDYTRIFPDLFRRLRDHYFDERRKTLRRNKENVLKYLSDDRRELSDKDRLQVESMLSTLHSRFGYCEHCGKDAIMFLMRKRYGD